MSFHFQILEQTNGFRWLVVSILRFQMVACVEETVGDKILPLISVAFITGAYLFINPLHEPSAPDFNHRS